MGDEDNRLREHLLQAQEFILHLASDQRVKCREWFVQEPDIGFDGQRACNADTLLLTTAKLTREIFLAPFQTDQLDNFQCARTAFVAILSAHLQREGDVFQYGAVRQKTK